MFGDLDNISEPIVWPIGWKHVNGVDYPIYSIVEDTEL